MELLMILDVMELLCLVWNKLNFYHEDVSNEISWKTCYNVLVQNSLWIDSRWDRFSELKDKLSDGYLAIYLLIS